MRSEFQDELEELINKFSEESGSDTPDFILAEYLNSCLAIFDRAVGLRETWYGRKHVDTLPPSVLEVIDREEGE
jgi:hypothetical protein